MKTIPVTSEWSVTVTAAVHSLLATRAMALVWLFVRMSAATRNYARASIGIILRILDLLLVLHVILALLVFLLAIVGTTSNGQNSGLVVFGSF